MKTTLTGYDLLIHPRLNKGTAFTDAERAAFGLHGLLPPHVGTLEEQRRRRKKGLDEETTSLQKYSFMRDLQDTNETLFYSLITHYIEETLPLVYTPTVGEACQQFSEIWRKPRGLFLSLPNRHLIDQIFAHPRYSGIKCIVVSDGERILGLGDQGAGGMGIPIGKMALYTALGGIAPERCLPILLDVGTENEERLQDPLYVGWRHRRVRGPEYDDFVELSSRRSSAVGLTFSSNGKTSPDQRRSILERYRDQLCTFNDDIQGTAAVATGTLLSAITVTGIPFSEQRVVFFGFGGAGMGLPN